MPNDYRVDIIERIKELVFDGFDLGPNDSFTYEWNHGYEKLYRHTDGHGSMEFAGAYHPDGYCWNGRPEDDDTNDGTGICNYCGRTLH